MENFKCTICNNKDNNKTYKVKEMMFGSKEEFKYFKCSNCDCLQISEIPENLSSYYPLESYYSFQSQQSHSSIKLRIDAFLHRKVVAYYIGIFNLLGYFSTLLNYRYRRESKWVSQLKGVKKSADILDVGCGAGYDLLDLCNVGFNNVTGVDTFINEDISYDCGVQIYKKSIFDLDKQYDFIMLNHCFEHMSNPHKTFAQLQKLLKPDGRLLIRIPVVDSFSWRKYGVSWYQIDAPRHLFLHTVKSMTLLANENNLELLNTVYDSNENQFYFSEKYIRGNNSSDKTKFNSKQFKEWRKHAAMLNRINDGDQAGFVFKKNN